MVKVDSKWQVWWLWHSLWHTSHYRWTCSYEEKEENLVDALSGAATTVVKMLQSNANMVTVSSHTQPKMNSVCTGISPLKFAQFHHNCLEGLKNILVPELGGYASLWCNITTGFVQSYDSWNSGLVNIQTFCNFLVALFPRAFTW